MIRRLTWLAAIPLALALTACGNGDPLADPTEDIDTPTNGGQTQPADPTGDPGTGGSGQSLVVGSQQYYSNEIIAELYATALEEAGYEIEREYQIGQREVYMPEIEAGQIDVFPEYGGNLLQYLDGENEAADSAAIMAALADVLPEGVRVLDPAEATDQDSYTVTRETADEYDLVSIGDLTNIGETVIVAANSEFEVRPYGPQGLQEVYGVQAQVLAVEDSGGPLTLGALLDGQAHVADIYTADPAISANDLVVLEDPENLILPQEVVPLVSDVVDDEAAAIINEVQVALTMDDLLALNTRSVDEQERADVLARDWLEEKGLI